MGNGGTSKRETPEARLTTSTQTAAEQIHRAFELAYFIHANKGIALCVARDAWGKLGYALDRQQQRGRYRPVGRNRRPIRRLRVSRTKVWLSDEHLLQCLVYAESDRWERCTEQGDGPYPLTEDDMVIRYVKHLVRITMRRNSFYVTLGIGRLLYNYLTSEVERIYQFAMGQDLTRFKDKRYVRQQKNVLMREVLDRFQGLVRVYTTEQQEERLQSLDPRPWLMNLVNTCLQTFTPWDTRCLLPERFDPDATIAAFSFTGADPDREHPIETNRIHTLLHPECFARLVRGLGLDSPETRLAVPQIFFSTGGEGRGDRFRAPKLEAEDYRHVQRGREELARRHKMFFAGRLRLYVDGVERASFDPRRTLRVRLEVGPEADVIEVRGEDAQGELVLTTLFVRCSDTPSGESLTDWIVLEGGQKVAVQLTPVWESGELQLVQVEVRYAETKPVRAVSWLAQRAGLALTEMIQPKLDGSGLLGWRWTWATKGGAAVAIVLAIIAATLTWYERQPLPVAPAPPRAERPRPPAIEPVTPTPPATPRVPPAPEEPSALIARAEWRRDPEALLQATPLGIPREEPQSINLSNQPATLLISVPIYYPRGQRYEHYRLTLVAAEKPIWQQSLRAPTPGSGALNQVLGVTLFPPRLPEADSYELRIEGRRRSGWTLLGRVPLRPVDRKD